MLHSPALPAGFREQLACTLSQWRPFQVHPLSAESQADAGAQSLSQLQIMPCGSARPCRGLFGQGGAADCRMTHVQHVRQEVEHDLGRLVGRRQQHVRLPLLQVTRPHALEQTMDTPTRTPALHLTCTGRSDSRTPSGRGANYSSMSSTLSKCGANSSCPCSARSSASSAATRLSPHSRVFSMV